MNPNVRRRRLVNTLQEKTPESGVCYQQAQSVFAGGTVGGNAQQNPWPIYMEKGVGAELWDIDQNVYLDCNLGSGSLILGHSHPHIQIAIAEQNKKCIMHSSQSSLQIEAAEKLSRFFPCSEKIFFCNSGTEAVHKSILLARASTKKNKIAKFEGSYHGTYDQSCLSVNQFGSDSESLTPVPMIAGIPDRAIADTVILPFNETQALELIEQHANELAAVLIEPIATIGLFKMNKDFVKNIRVLCTQKNIPLIFDEVLTGFRVGLGGCQKYFDVTPDIATYGKALGGGTAVGAMACSEYLLAGLLNASPPLRLGGTFSGNPLTMAATNAALDTMLDANEFSFEDLNKNCLRLTETLNQKLSTVDLPVTAASIGSMFFIHINDALTNSPKSLKNEDGKKQDELCLRLKINGVYADCAHTSFISSAHSSQQIDKLINTYFECIKACFEKDTD